MAQDPKDIAALFAAARGEPAVKAEDLSSGLTPDEIEYLKQAQRNRLKNRDFSAGEYVQQFGSSALRGLASVPAAIPAVAGVISAGIDPNIDISEYRQKTAGGRIATGIEDAGGGIIPPVPGLEDSFAGDLGSGIGSGVGFIATGGAGAALRVPRMLIPAVTGAMVNGIGGLDDAQANGATPEQQWLAFAVNAGVGTTEAVPIANMFARVNKRSGGVFESIVRAAAANAGEEAVQEGLQQLAQDQLAKWTYDEDRDVLEGVMRGASVGGLSGLLFGAGVQAAHERKVGTKINRLLSEAEIGLRPERAEKLKDQFTNLTEDDQKALAALERVNQPVAEPEGAEEGAKPEPVLLRAAMPKTEGDADLAEWARARGARVLFAEREDGQAMNRAGGVTDGSTIVIDVNATPQQRRAYWAHELVHHLRNVSGSDWDSLYEWVKKYDPKGLKAVEAAYAKRHKEVHGTKIEKDLLKEESLSTRVERMGDWLAVYALKPELLENAKPGVVQRIRDGLVGMMRSRLSTSLGLRTTEERRMSSVLDALGGAGSEDMVRAVGDALEAATSDVAKQARSAEKSISETAITEQPKVSEEDMADEATVAELSRKYDQIWAQFERERLADIRGAAEYEAGGKIDPDIEQYIASREYEIAATLADAQRKEMEAKSKAAAKELRKTKGKQSDKAKGKQAEKKPAAEEKKPDEKKPSRRARARVAPEAQAEELAKTAEEVVLGKVETALAELGKKVKAVEEQAAQAEAKKSKAAETKKGGDSSGAKSADDAADKKAALEELAKRGRAGQRQREREQLRETPAAPRAPRVAGATKAERYLAGLPIALPPGKKGRSLTAIYRGMVAKENKRLRSRLIREGMTDAEMEKAEEQIAAISSLREQARLSTNATQRAAAQAQLRVMGKIAEPEKMAGSVSPELVAEFIRARDAADKQGVPYKPGDTLEILVNGRPERFALVFHGSPNYYTMIDPNMIDSGEGTQLEGRGYYVATHPGSAPSYATGARTGPVMMIDGKRPGILPSVSAWGDDLDDPYGNDLSEKRKAAAIGKNLMAEVDRRLIIEHGENPDRSEFFKDGTGTFADKKQILLSVNAAARDMAEDIAGSQLAQKAVNELVSRLKRAKSVAFIRNIPTTFALDLDIKPDNFLIFTNQLARNNPDAAGKLLEALKGIPGAIDALESRGSEYGRRGPNEERWTNWRKWTVQGIFNAVAGRHGGSIGDPHHEDTIEFVEALKAQGLIGHAYEGEIHPNMVVYDPNKSLRVLWVSPVGRFLKKQPYDMPSARQGVAPLHENFLERAILGQSLEDPNRLYSKPIFPGSTQGLPYGTDMTERAPDFKPIGAKFALSQTGANWEMDEENLGRKANRALADRFEGVRTLVKRANEAQPVLDEENPDLAEQAFPGRVRARIEQLRRIRDEVVKTLRDAGLTLEQADQYIYALHAPDRNRLMAERSPRKFAYQPGTVAGPKNRPGSGMDDVTAKQIVDDAHASPEADAYRRVASILRKVNKRALEVRVKSGLLPKKVARQWRKDFGKNYVPLLNEPNQDESDTVYGSGSTFNTYGPEAQTAKGRLTLAGSPISASLQRAEQVVVRSERDRVGQRFAAFARKYPNSKAYEFVKPSRVPFDARDQLFKYKKKGKEKVIWLKDSTLREAMKGLNVDPLPPIMRMLAKGSKFLRLVNTVYSPDFVFTNPLRDVQTGAINLVGARSPDFAKAAMGMLPTARKAMWAALKDPQGYSGPLAAEAREYISSGGLSGMESPEMMDSISKDIQKRIDAGGPLEKVKAFGDWWERLNSHLENTARFAAYVEARKRGESRDSAVNLAKNLTVNFDRRGQMSGTLGALYLFFNAGLQGSLRTLTALKDRRVMALMGLQVAAGFYLSALNRAFSDDDDNGVNEWDLFPDWAKERNLVLPVPGSTDRVMMPLPLGYNLFWRLGGLVEQARHGRGLKPADFASSIAKTAVESFSPIQGGSPLQTLAPTAVDPFVQVLENKDWAGRRIMPESTRRPDIPDSAKVKDSPEFLRSAMAWLNRITGGNEFRPGVVDVSPESVEHVFENFTGSLGQTVERSLKLASSFMGGDPDQATISNVAVMRRLWAKANPKAAAETLYYENANEAEVQRRMARAGVPSDRRFAGIQQAFDTRIQALRDARKLAESRGNTELARRYDERITAVMQRANRRLVSMGIPE